jgi:NDP-sugar pyrophosphorylase family protein
MKAMILAAGLGTRLRPLTSTRPKALVEIEGRTLLQIALLRLRAFGISEVIINLHHLADMVLEYLESNHNFGMRIVISREDNLLDTGGGLKQAADFFLGDSKWVAEPFLVHNVDVLSTIDLGRMAQMHAENQALATLAVQARQSSRYLLFDQQLQLCGRRSGPDQQPPQRAKSGLVGDPGAEIVRSSPPLQALAFSGIHVISPRLLKMMTEEGAFSVITTYLRLAAQGEKILAFRADDYYWRDVGNPENLAQAAQDLKQKTVPQ